MAETPSFDVNRLAGLDKQIDTLLSCKPLPESEISKLCDMVGELSASHQQYLNVLLLCVG